MICLGVYFEDQHVVLQRLLSSQAHVFILQAKKMEYKFGSRARVWVLFHFSLASYPVNNNIPRKITYIKAGKIESFGF